ncbi:hypothetical protein KHA80_14165 [Anaerobacillus sp. HL2]|nr:hypothetical protein KHA80_14165 [Anaerobacillus sp. HL2]
MKLLERFKNKAQALRVAKQAGASSQLLEMKNGIVNTYVPHKERTRRKKAVDKWQKSFS